MNSPGTRLVIAGMPRSGTTLLATLVSAQPDCLFLTDYLGSFMHAARQLDVRFGQPLTRTQRLVTLAMVRDELIRRGHPVLVPPEEFETIADLHRLVLGELSDEPRALVGHKMLVEPRELEQLLAVADLRVIVLVRDPRDAALSYWHRVGRGVEGYVARWKETFEALRVLRASPSLLALRFEDLITRPEATLQHVSDHVHLAMNLPSEGLRFRRSPGAFGPVWHGNSGCQDVDRRFDARAVGRWRHELSSPVVRFAAWRCAREIGDMGYPPTPPSVPGLAERVRFAAHTVVHAGHDRLRETTEHLRDRLAPPIRHG